MICSLKSKLTILLCLFMLAACSKKDDPGDLHPPEVGGILFYAALKSKSAIQTVYTDADNNRVDYSSPEKVNMDLRIFASEGRYFYGSSYYSRCLYNAIGTGSYCTLVEYKENGQVAQWARNIGTYGEVADMAFIDNYVVVASPDLNNYVTMSIFNKNDLNTRLRQVKSLKDASGQTVNLKCGRVTAFNNKIYTSNPDGEEVFVFDKEYLVNPDVKGNTNLNSIASLGKRGQFFDLLTNNSDPSVLGKVRGLHHVFGYLLINSLVGTDKYKMDIYKDEKYVRSVFECVDRSGMTYYPDNTSSITEIDDQYVACLSRSTANGPKVLIFDKDVLLNPGSGPVQVKDVLSVAVNGNDRALNIATLDGNTIIVNSDKDRTLYVYQIKLKKFNKG